MKKSIISMMIIGMMTLSTTNSFGSVNNSHFQSSKTEKVVKYDKNCNCKTCKDIRKKQEQQKKQLQKKQKQCSCSTCKKLHKQQPQTCMHQHKTVMTCQSQPTKFKR